MANVHGEHKQAGQQAPPKYSLDIFFIFCVSRPPRLSTLIYATLCAPPRCRRTHTYTDAEHAQHCTYLT